jgi:hypothetical protein
MTNTLQVYNQFDQLERAAIALKESGYFKDVQSKAQAVVKVMAGAELGLPPFASMAGIHIIQGKPVLGANVLATLVKNDPRYDYRIETATNQVCGLTWFEGGKNVGESGFTMEEAKAAGLVGKDNWKKYPSDMLFARAISRGARRFAPGIFGGAPVYTPDELGADVDEEGNVVVESTAVDVTEPDPEPENGQPTEPVTKGKSWSVEIVEAFKSKDNGIVEDENQFQAVGVLNALRRAGADLDDIDKAVSLGQAYRAERNNGIEDVDEAARLAVGGE